MRKFLRSLPREIVLQVAGDLGVPTNDLNNAIEHIVETSKAYRLSVADIKSRYEISR